MGTPIRGPSGSAVRENVDGRGTIMPPTAAAIGSAAWRGLPLHRPPLGVDLQSDEKKEHCHQPIVIHPQ